MRRDWQNTALGSAFKTVTGTTPPKSNTSYYGHYIPFVKPPELCNGLLDSSVDGLSEVGARVARAVAPCSILVSCIGNLGKIGMNVVPVAFNQQINAILPNKSKAIPEFMFFQVLSNLFKDQLEDLASGTTVPSSSINPEYLIVSDCFASAPEQRRIVGILDKAFESIATAKANAKSNLQHARALLESYIHNFFYRQGDGWEVKTIDQLATNLDSMRVPITKCDRKRDSFPYYGASGIVDYVENYIFEGDTLLVSEDGANLVARATPIAFSVSGKYWVNNHAHILRFANFDTQRYVEHYLQNVKLDKYLYWGCSAETK